jgi:hypothetical protein
MVKYMIWKDPNFSKSTLKEKLSKYEILSLQHEPLYSIYDLCRVVLYVTISSIVLAIAE